MKSKPRENIELKHENYPVSLKNIRHKKYAMRLSLITGFFMLILKLYTYYLTGSAAVLSDAAESVVHILAVAFAAYSLWLSLKPADASHLYGHDRVSFFSAGFEGAMIVFAAFYIIYESINKWLHGLHLQNIEYGTVFIAIATIINGFLGWYLVNTGKKYNSIVLVANGKHVLTDSWTSLGVIITLGLTLLTGWLILDPIIAIFIAINIIWSGTKLIRTSIGGLMDEADPDVHDKLIFILDEVKKEFEISYHDLRHRNSGNQLFVELHLLFSDKFTLASAHVLATQIESKIIEALPLPTRVITHLEPLKEHDASHSQSQSV